MGFLTWILLGLVAGILAKWIMPGKDGGGFIMTVLLGVAGAFVGGYIGSKLGIGATDGFNIVSIATATAGAFLLLFIYNKVSK
ncbi:MAG: GlsB/YeaQ/YmgE family stress response membrane protein [Gammaproteobacteria bacterium]|nr:GlsB/YeaQ/YmgE family stress response membrane protein [Gammaproteobacteria bacterium]